MKRQIPRFDLNQTRLEPSDEELDSLMGAVNEQVLKSGASRRSDLRRKLRADIHDIFTRHSRNARV